ncbi:MAG: ribosome recycling factor [Bacteroidota bacterium]|mgnify:CR=1 FL=1|nr:ribosome recycling factor [Bacteroidota bacterium]MDX5429955.1 ribosome recycling factor [Bacteroidota bacterium]MDX5468728.1 ribosome recycling factor [Bacteroidota bacterium]
MTDEIKQILDSTRSGMDKAIGHLNSELAKIRAGKASPAMLEGLSVDYYGAMTPLNQAANVSTPDARTLVIQPWDKTLISSIERAIMESNLGLNPQNDGEVIRLNVPPLTEERRKQLVKTAKSETENSKVAIRNIRKESNEKVKRLQKDGLAEDLAKDAEVSIQQITDQFIAKVDEIASVKEKEIMTV